MKRSIIIGIIILFAGFNRLHGQEEKYISLFLYNFTKYFDWPSSSKSGDFVIEVLGHKSVYDKLAELSQAKKVGTQNIVVKNFNDPEQMGNGNIIFVGHWHSKYLPDILEKCMNKNTLIITEKDGLIQQGSAINFVIRDNTIKFEFSKKNALKYNLKIDPRIEQLAVKVYN